MLQLIFNFFGTQLAILHAGDYFPKFKASFYLGAALSPIALIIEKSTSWYIDNQTYIHWVCVAILIDLFTGVFKHIRNFSWGSLGKGLLIKVGMAVMAGILFEALPFFLQEGNVVSDSLLVVTRLSVFMYPAGSAWMNMATITGGKFPPIGWINKLKYFNENLDLNHFKNGKSSETN